MTPMRQAKRGGVLLGMVVAMVAVAVLSVAMVKSLQGQAVTGGRAYNLMRARYAADSGYEFFSSLTEAQKLAYAALGDVPYTLGNGDQFVISATTNATYLFAQISGKRMGGGEVLAVRTLNRRILIGGGPGVDPPGDTLPGDDLDEDLDLEGVGQIEVEEDNWHDYKDNLADFIDMNRWGQKKVWLETHAALLNLHEKFIMQDLPTLRGSSLKVRTDLDMRHAEIDPSANNHVVWAVALPLNYQSQATAALENGYLSYEAQMKISWQELSLDFDTAYSRVTGAQGVAFKLHGNETDGYEFYAVTLMRFRDATEEENRITSFDELDRANLAGSDSSDGYWGIYDCIPNDIKPPGQKDKYLLVLWKQEQGNNNPVRTWIAYQDLSSDSIADFMLDATLYVSVAEGIDGANEFVDVRMMVGDCAFKDSPAGDTDPYNRGKKSRRRYRNSTDPADKFSTTFPVWPPVPSQDWTADVDYYTVSEATATVLNNDTTAEFQSDDQTIRLYGGDYLFENQTGQLGDLGLVFCGNFMSGIDHDLVNNNGVPEVEDLTEIDIPSLYMAVDDLAVKWAGGSVQTGTGTDIITDF